LPNKLLLNSPALLWLGSNQVLLEKAYELFEQIYGVPSFNQRQHHAISWFAPEKQYLVEQIDEVLERLSLSLEPNQHHFIVLERADSLTPATANRLLKSLEEPPPGYHFLLLAERGHGILPTIRSRCVVTAWEGAAQSSPHQPIIDLFFTPRPNPADFLAQLEQTPIPETEALGVVDELLARWIATKKTDSRGIEVLTKALEHPPMPGSSKLFWKNLYLQLTQ
jgi:DNA polymerase-3 subunit delta'